MGNVDTIVATGFNKKNERQIKLFDMRKPDETIQSLTIDSQSYNMQPYFDPDTNLLFIPGKGESSVKYYELINGQFKKASDYSSQDSARSSIFLPKRFCNYNRCELAQMLKLTKNWISYVHFIYPKKVNKFI